MDSAGPRLLILGWDSATFDVIDPLIEQGRLPALARLMEPGFRAPLRSTWPPMTDSAWTSAFTGCNPGKHGIFGSWYRAPGAYAVQVLLVPRSRSSGPVGARRWDHVPRVECSHDLSAAGGSGSDGGGIRHASGVPLLQPGSPSDAMAGRWDLDDSSIAPPTGLLDRYLEELVRGLRAQAEALPWAIRETGADCVAAVWPHVDRAQHFFWQFRATDHPLAGAVDSVYEEMDRTTAALLESFPDADVLVISDHGAGALHGDVNVGAWLARSGYARYGTAPRSRLGAAWRLPPTVPSRRQARPPVWHGPRDAGDMSEGLGPFDWSQTRAFMGVNGDLWINQEGREPEGMVPESSAPALIDEIREAALALRDPSSGALFVRGSAPPR